jgi:subtilisin family serine protease
MLGHRHLSAASLLGAVLLFTIGYGSPIPVAGQRTARAGQGVRRDAQKYVPGQLLVRFRGGVSKRAIQAEHALVRAEVLKEFRVVENLQLVRLPAGIAVEQGERYYRARPNVLYAEPNYLRQAVQAPLTPNDPRFSEMWNLHNTGQSGGTPGADIHAPEAWGLITGSSSVVVAVIDSGIDYKHVDLAANIWSSTSSYAVTLNGKIVICGAGTHGFNAITQTCDPMDDFSHGTHVAGTIGASGNNGAGVVGINWQVQLMACKFLNSRGSGLVSDEITCLEYVALMKDRGVNLIATNNSYGNVYFSQAEMDAIDSHRQRGILFVAAAANSHANNDVASFYPANYGLPHMISVAATDRKDALADFSNFGRHTVHLSAPGKEILSTVPGGRYEVYSGTSMATPHVTGVAALLKAQDLARDWKAIKNLILAGGDTVPGLSNTITQKRLNAYGAIICSNSVVQTRLQPMAEDAYVWSGDSLTFAVLNINCSTPNGPVEISLDEGAETITLADDGISPDLEADDGVYVAQRKWLDSEVGDHTLTFPNGDVVTVHVIPPLAAYTYSTAVPFNYREIAGTDLILGEDDGATIRPPFPIQFGGFSFPTLNVNSNGNLTFFRPFADWDNSPLPASIATLVAPFWDDLYPLEDSSIRWDVIGSAPNRELVIEWHDVGHMACFNNTSPARFQIVFFEGSSDILFNYADVNIGAYDQGLAICLEPVNGGASATVGIQWSNSLANQFSFMTPSLTDNSSILWQLGQLKPAITQLSPFAVLAGSPARALRVLGRSFLPGAVVRWNGSDRPTTFVNAGELKADISASDLATAGTAQITVFNPPPDGSGESARAPFQIYSSYPVPRVTSVAPNPLTWNSTSVLTVTGTNFIPWSVASWNGASRATTVLNSTTLQMAQKSNGVGQGGQDTQDIGTAYLTVSNPAPGGGTSNSAPVGIVNPAPILRFTIPARIAVGSPAFALQVWGSQLTPTSVARWNGGDRATTHDAYNYLTAALTATDIASVGTAQVTVFTPTPGGGTSNPLTVSIVTPPFTLASNPTTQSVSHGTTATYTIKITPQSGGFNDPVSVSCGVAPAGPACSLSQYGVTLGHSAATVTLTVDTTHLARLETPAEPTPLFALWLVLPALGIVVAGTTWTDEKRVKRGIFLALVLIVASLGMLNACGGGGEKAGGGGGGGGAQNYTITVTGASGPIDQQTTVFLPVTLTVTI